MYGFVLWQTIVHNTIEQRKWKITFGKETCIGIIGIIHFHVNISFFETNDLSYGQHSDEAPKK